MRLWELPLRSSAGVWRPPGCRPNIFSSTLLSHSIFFLGVFISLGASAEYAADKTTTTTTISASNTQAMAYDYLANKTLNHIIYPAEMNSSVLADVAIVNRAILDETGYGHQHKRDAVDSDAPRWPLSDFLASSPPPPVRLADLAIVAPIAELVFHANESLVHVRTDAWLLPYDTCLEARFRLEGKRTRLLIYTCQMTEGGECKLDKFTATDTDVTEGLSPRNQNIVVTAERTFGSIDVERCVQLRPWIFHRTPFAFHFKFVRRSRRFSDPLIEERHRRRRRLGKRATRVVGHVTMKGFKDCSSTCKPNANNSGWLDGSIRESIELAKYDPSKRRRRRRRLHIHRN